MTAILYLCDLARKADSVVTSASLASKIVPLLSPECGEAATQLDDSWGVVSLG